MDFGEVKDQVFVGQIDEALAERLVDNPWLVRGMALVLVDQLFKESKMVFDKAHFDEQDQFGLATYLNQFY